MFPQTMCSSVIRNFLNINTSNRMPFITKWFSQLNTFIDRLVLHGERERFQLTVNQSLLSFFYSIIRFNQVVWRKTNIRRERIYSDHTQYVQRIIQCIKIREQRTIEREKIWKKDEKIFFPKIERTLNSLKICVWSHQVFFYKSRNIFIFLHWNGNVCIERVSIAFKLFSILNNNNK